MQVLLQKIIVIEVKHHIHHIDSDVTGLFLLLKLRPLVQFEVADNKVTFEVFFNRHFQEVVSA